MTSSELRAKSINDNFWVRASHTLAGLPDLLKNKEIVMSGDNRLGRALAYAEAMGVLNDQRMYFMPDTMRKAMWYRWIPETGDEMVHYFNKKTGMSLPISERASDVLMQQFWEGVGQQMALLSPDEMRDVAGAAFEVTMMHADGVYEEMTFRPYIEAMIAAALASGGGEKFGEWGREQYGRFVAAQRSRDRLNYADMNNSSSFCQTERDARQIVLRMMRPWIVNGGSGQDLDEIGESLSFFDFRAADVATPRLALGEEATNNEVSDRDPFLVIELARMYRVAPGSELMELFVDKEQCNNRHITEQVVRWLKDERVTGTRVSVSKEKFNKLKTKVLERLKTTLEKGTQFLFDEYEGSDWGLKDIWALMAVFESDDVGKALGWKMDEDQRIIGMGLVATELGKIYMSKKNELDPKDKVVKQLESATIYALSRLKGLPGSKEYYETLTEDAF